MTASPSFSIVIPTFQRREVVSDALRALCATRYDGTVEIIVVIDGSTDGTPEALAEIDCPFPIRIIEQTNSGAASARNRGAAEASGEILLFLDDDIMAMPDLVEQHAQSHRAGADAVLGHIPLDPASPPSVMTTGVGRWAEDRARRLGAGAELTLFDLLTGQLSVKRALFEELGGFDTAFTAGGSFGNEDLDFGIRLLKRARVEFNPEAVSLQRYVVTPRQLIKQWSDAARADITFSLKHPAHAAELFDLHGGRRWTTRLLLRPAAAIPGVARAASGAAVRLAEREQSLPPPLRGVAARMLGSARNLAYWSAYSKGDRTRASSRLLVLCYHAIADLSGDRILADYGIDRRTFESQLDSLLKRGFTFVTPGEAAALFKDRGRAPDKAVLLTFDDCYRELTGVAETILKPRGIEAIAFAVTGMRSGTNEWDQAIGARSLDLLDADGLRELASHGVEIGCHSRSHRSLPSLSDAALREETDGAAEDIAALGLPRPRFFAYPHGEQDERSRQKVEEAGFVAGFGLSSDWARGSGSRYNVPRVEVLASDAGWRFRLKTSRPRLAALLDYRSILQTTFAKAVYVLRRAGALPART